MVKKISKVVVMSLLVACMLGNSASAAETHVHTWVQTGNSNINSWSYTHTANTDGGYCGVYCWVSSVYEQCSVCKEKINEVFTEHGRHSFCVGADYDRVL